MLRIAFRNICSLEGAFSAFLALFLLVGRWSPGRVLEDSSFSSSVSLRMLVLGIMAIFPFLFLFRSKNVASERVPRHPIYTLSFLILTLISYLAASVVWAPDWDLAVSVLQDLGFLGGMLCVFTAVLVLCDLRRLLFSFWMLIFFGTSFLLTAGTWSLFQSGFHSIDQFRFSVFGGGPIVFGRNMGLLVLACLFAWSHKILAKSVIGIGVLAFFFIILSGSRGALISAVLALVAYFVWERMSIKRLIFLSSFAFLSVAVISQSGLITNLAHEVYDQRINKLLLEEHYTSGRVDRFYDALEIISEKPVFGSGIGGYTFATGYDYPHNIFLELLIDGGLVGLLLFLACLAYGLKRSFWQRGSVDSASLAGFVLFFAGSQTSGDLYDSRFTFVFILFAFGLAVQERARQFRYIYYLESREKSWTRLDGRDQHHLV